MIVERLHKMKSGEVKLPNHSLEDSRNLSEVEENAIYYVAGYLIRKLIYKHQNLKRSDSKSKVTVVALWGILGEDYNSVNAQCSFNDYIRTWTTTNDRGGLKHVSLDTFNCFKAIEL